MARLVFSVRLAELNLKAKPSGGIDKYNVPRLAFVNKMDRRRRFF